MLARQIRESEFAGLEPIIVLVWKAAEKLGMCLDGTPSSFTPAHSYHKYLGDLVQVLRREANLTIIGGGGADLGKKPTWDVQSLFSVDRKDEKTGAFWRCVKQLSGHRCLSRQVIPMLKYLAKRTQLPGRIECLDVLLLCLGAAVNALSNANELGLDSPPPDLNEDNKEQKQKDLEDRRVLLELPRLVAGDVQEDLLALLPTLRKILLESLGQVGVLGRLFQLTSLMLDLAASSHASDKPVLGAMRSFAYSGWLECWVTVFSELQASDEEHAPVFADTQILTYATEFGVKLFPGLIGHHWQILDTSRPNHQRTSNPDSSTKLLSEGHAPKRHHQFFGSVTVRLSTGKDMVIPVSSLTDNLVDLDANASSRSSRMRPINEVCLANKHLHSNLLLKHLIKPMFFCVAMVDDV